MLISLDKNKWLYDWMQDQWKDEIHEILVPRGSEVPRPFALRAKLTVLLNSKGYKAKLTSKHDIIVSLKEEEFVFLKLKYF